jgi:DNA-3-methyladenine glycosylase
LTPGADRGPRLGRDFFGRDPTAVAADLLGCTLSARGAGGRIVETEAYHEGEPACHAYVGRTERTEVLYGPPGFAYVYLSYGIHQLFNVVTGGEGHGAAVLIRALEPDHGLERIRERRPGRPERELCSGPGRLTRALGISAADNRLDLCGGAISIHARPEADPPRALAGPRIGISKAADLPWRYCDASRSEWLSAAPG